MSLDDHEVLFKPLSAATIEGAGLIKRSGTLKDSSFSPGNMIGGSISGTSFFSIIASSSVSSIGASGSGVFVTSLPNCILDQCPCSGNGILDFEQYLRSSDDLTSSSSAKRDGFLPNQIVKFFPAKIKFFHD